MNICVFNSRSRWLLTLILEMVADYIEVPIKIFLEEFMKILSLSPLSITGQVGHDGRSVVGIRFVLGQADEARSLYHEAIGVTITRVQQAGSLMVILMCVRWRLEMLIFCKCSSDATRQ